MGGAVETSNKAAVLQAVGSGAVGDPEAFIGQGDGGGGGGSCGTVAAYFEAANTEHLSIADASQTNLDPGTSDFTIAFWAYVTDVTATRFLVSKSAGAANNGYEIFTAGSKIQATIDSTAAAASSWTSTETISNATWYFVVITFDRSGNGSIIINDGTPTTADISAHDGTSIDNTNPYEIGVRSYNTTSPFDGRILWVAHWNKVLPSGEITSIYNSGAGKCYADLDATEKTNLISWWLDDAGTSLTADAVGTNTLTDNNSTQTADGPNA